MKPKPQRVRQPTPAELTDACLDFLRRKFYNQPGDEKCFAQDRRLLLSWVVLWPATYFNSKALTVHGDTYREIFHKVFFDAAAHCTDKIKYRPAWMRHVIRKHFDIHGEEYLDRAKAVRNLAEQALLVVGQRQQVAPDPVREMANARRILTTGAPKKALAKPTVKAQLTLFS